MAGICSARAVVRARGRCVWRRGEARDRRAARDPLFAEVAEHRRAMVRRRATTSAPPSKPTNSSKPAEPHPKPSPPNHCRNIALITTLVGGPYALWLGYLFIGIAIISDIFME